MLTRRYQYCYAVIDPTLNDMCIRVEDTTVDCSEDPNYIAISEYNGNYLCKYYDRATGKWYLEAEHINEWVPA
jgi:hypothetical protein